MATFEPLSSDVSSDHSVNFAATTAKILFCLYNQIKKIIEV